MPKAAQKLKKQSFRPQEEFPVLNNVIEFKKPPTVTRKDLEQIIRGKDKQWEAKIQKEKISLLLEEKQMMVQDAIALLKRDGFGKASATLLEELHNYFYFENGYDKILPGASREMREQKGRRTGAVFLLIDCAYRISKKNQEIYALENKINLAETEL